MSFNRSVFRWTTYKPALQSTQPTPPRWFRSRGGRGCACPQRARHHHQFTSVDPCVGRSTTSTPGFVPVVHPAIGGINSNRKVQIVSKTQQFYTSGSIAKALDQDVVRVRGILNTRRFIEPIGRAGQAWIYDKAAVEQVRKELAGQLRLS